MSDVYETVTIENLSEASSLGVNDLLLISQNSTEKKLPASKLGGAIIDDSSTANNKVLSAQKVTNELAGKQATLNTAQMAAVNSGITAGLVEKGAVAINFTNATGTANVRKRFGVATFNINAFWVENEITSGTQIGQIPEGYRPLDFLRFPVIQLNTGITREIRINTNGIIDVGQAGSLSSGYWIGSASWIIA